MRKNKKEGPASTSTGSTAQRWERARAAMAGELSPRTLTEEERRCYYDLLDDVMANPTPEEIAAMAEIGRQPGAVGCNDAGQLVRVCEDGSEEILAEATED